MLRATATYRLIVLLLCETVFAPVMSDVEWMSELAAEGGWNVVSTDNFRKSNAGT